MESVEDEGDCVSQNSVHCRAVQPPFVGLKYELDALQVEPGA